MGRGSSKAGGGNVSISAKERQIFDSIRFKKREQLIIYDDEGNVIDSEGGKKNHTGYEEHDYKNMNAVHNHPPGVAYYPSNQDLITFHESGAKSMTVVSPNHTVKIVRTPKVNKSDYTLSSDAAIDNAIVPGVRDPFGNLSASQYRAKHNVSISDTNKMKAEYKMAKIRKIMENAGYKVIVE